MQRSARFALFLEVSDKVWNQGGKAKDHTLFSYRTINDKLFFLYNVLRRLAVNTSTLISLPRSKLKLYSLTNKNDKVHDGATNIRLFAGVFVLIMKYGFLTVYHHEK